MFSPTMTDLSESRMGTEYQSERILLRPHVTTDLPRMLQIWSDPLVMRSLTGGPKTRERGMDAFHRLVQTGKGVRQSYHRAIIRRDDNVLIGTIGIDLERFSSGYTHSMVMHRETWGAGLASEAYQLLLFATFEHLRLHRVWTVCAQDNERAQRLITRAGFTWFGVIREFCPGPKGWLDVEAYSYLDHEWRARQGGFAGTGGT